MGSLLSLVLAVLSLGALAFVLQCLLSFISYYFNQSSISDKADLQMDRMSDSFGSFKPLRKTKFNLTEKQQAMWTTIAKHNNLLNKDRDLTSSRDLVKGHGESAGDRYLTSLVVLALAGLLLMLAIGIQLTKKTQFKTLMGNAGLLVFTVMAGVILGVLLIAYKCSKAEAKQNLQQADDNYTLPLNESTVPLVAFSNGAGDDRVMYADAIQDLNLIYRVNADIMPENQEQFLNSFKMMKPNDSQFEGMTEVVQKLSQNPDAMKMLIKNHDPLIKQIQEWNQEYHDFLEKLMGHWLDLSLVNKAKYQQKLISNGDTNLMDTDTNYKYFHEIGKTIDELHGTK